MNVRIGVQHCSRELAFETDLGTDELQAQIQRAISSGELLVLTDSKGGVVCVPGASIGYVELGAPRKGGVGFGTI